MSSDLFAAFGLALNSIAAGSKSDSADTWGIAVLSTEIFTSGSTGLPAPPH